MTKKFIFYLIIIMIISAVIADREKVDEIPYNGLIPSSNSFQYQEYPMVVPKRAALLLDRIMVALQRALEDGGAPPRIVRPPLAAINDDQIYPEYDAEAPPPLELALMRDDQNVPQARVALRDLVDVDSRQAQQKMMGLQRRGHGTTTHPKGRVWRCYFNAITCFKK